METHLRKTTAGWKASTYVDFNPALHQKLKISTYKSDRGLLTTASVHVCEDTTESFVIFQDFLERVRLSNARCTEKSVRDQHHAAIMELGDILERARMHYRKGT